MIVNAVVLVASPYAESPGKNAVIEQLPPEIMFIVGGYVLPLLIVATSVSLDENVINAYLGAVSVKFVVKVKA